MISFVDEWFWKMPADVAPPALSLACAASWAASPPVCRRLS
ncbi:MAG: hypothetical protein WDN30_00560 [Pararobbsia sp.]